jgi:hypothetical protein
MDQGINAGYIITDRLTVGNVEFVIGQSEEAPANFVTWKCRKGEKEYFWGHYMNDRLTALEDLCKRAMEEIQYVRNLEQGKDVIEQPVQQHQRKGHVPER